MAFGDWLTGDTVLLIQWHTHRDTAMIGVSVCCCGTRKKKHHRAEYSRGETDNEPRYTLN